LLSGIVRFKDRYFAQTGMTFELWTLGGALLFGLLILPALIWTAGRLTLGGYANGGPWALYWDFLRGLAKGGASYWIALVGPYALLLFARLLAALWRRTR
jgi:hypothetical protein